MSPASQKPAPGSEVPSHAAPQLAYVAKGSRQKGWTCPPKASQ